MESKFFLKLGNVVFKVAQPLEYAVFGVVHLLLQNINAPALLLNRIKMVAQGFKNSLDGLVMGMEMFEYFLDVILMVSELAIGVFQVFAKLFHFFLDLYIELFALGDVLFAAVNNLHKSCQLTKHVTIKIHCRCNNHNRVAFGEGDDCNSITSRPLT